MFRISFKQLRLVILHLVFWVGVWFFFVYFFSYNSDDRRYVFWFSSGLLPLTMAVSYFVVYYLIPRYLLTKQYAKLALYGFYTLVFSSYIIVLLIYACLIFLLNFHIAVMPPMSKNFFFILILVFLVVGLVSFASILTHHYQMTARNKELQNKILATQLQLKEQELNYLKMQIHPHFLFNTLNTIYGFALKESKQTPDMILKLSNLLDYILYQVNKPRVRLKDEMAHIQEYLELERVRFQESLQVDMQVEAVDETVQVAPMLFFPFVENAFKHGRIVDGFLQIIIDFTLADNRIRFGIRNTIREEEMHPDSGGIGLENSKKRLELHYPGAYRLDYQREPDWFIVNLEIELP